MTKKIVTLAMAAIAFVVVGAFLMPYSGLGTQYASSFSFSGFRLIKIGNDIDFVESVLGHPLHSHDFGNKTCWSYSEGLYWKNIYLTDYLGWRYVGLCFNNEGKITEKYNFVPSDP